MPWPRPPATCKQCHLILCTGRPLHSGSAPLNQQEAALPSSGGYFQKCEMSVKQDSFSKNISLLIPRSGTKITDFEQICG